MDERSDAGCAGRASLLAALQQAGIEARIGFETEWVISTGNPARTPTPAYGAIAVEQHPRYVESTLAGLTEAGIPVDQMHAEYGAGQFEVSVSPASALAATDNIVLTRQVIRRTSQQHGLTASFSPLFEEGQIGSGAHVHISVRARGARLMAGGPDRYGLHPMGEAFIAGILAEIGALTAVLAPSLVSRARLSWSTWSGAYASWGITIARRPCG